MAEFDVVENTKEKFPIKGNEEEQFPIKENQEWTKAFKTFEPRYVSPSLALKQNDFINKNMFEELWKEEISETHPEMSTEPSENNEVEPPKNNSHTNFQSHRTSPRTILT